MSPCCNICGGIFRSLSFFIFLLDACVLNLSYFDFMLKVTFIHSYFFGSSGNVWALCSSTQDESEP